MVSKILISIMLLFSINTLTAQNNSTLKKTFPKKAYKYVEEMLPIPAGELIIHTNPAVKSIEKDSSLIIDNFDKKCTINSFHLSDHEVTNYEYKQFTNWVKRKRVVTLLNEYLPERYPSPEEGVLPYDMEFNMEGAEEVYILETEGYYIEEGKNLNSKSIDRQALIFPAFQNGEWKHIKVYPDTTVWINDFPYSFNAPMTQNYYWHPAYDPYPVIGVSYYQALAYCQWLTDRINEEILIAEKVIKERSWEFSTQLFSKFSSNKKHLHLLISPIRLPSEKEWTYASQAYSGDLIEQKMNKLTKYNANIINSKVNLKLENSGQVKDKIVEIIVQISGETFVAEEGNKKFETSFDQALTSIKRQMKRHKEKIIDRKRSAAH